MLKIDLTLKQHKFKNIKLPILTIPECIYLSKRQTFNVNRAICAVELTQLPDNLSAYLTKLRKKIAFKVGFFPLFYGVGIQIIIICPGSSKLSHPLTDFVAKSDNQWAIIQSIFLVDPITLEYKEARTWGQVITGKYQDEISKQLSTKYENITPTQ